MHLQVCLQIPGLVFRGIFWLCGSVGFAAVGRKRGLTWLESPCTTNQPCLPGAPPASGAQLQHVLCHGFGWVCGVWHLSGEGLSPPTCVFVVVLHLQSCLDPVLGHAAVLGCFLCAVHEGLGMLSLRAAGIFTQL